MLLVSRRSGGAWAVVLNGVHVAYVSGSVRSFSASAVRREVSSARFSLPSFPPSFH